MGILRDNSILTTLREPSGRRAGVYAFSELLNLAEGKDVL
jgi:hypothetical protein